MMKVTSPIFQLKVLVDGKPIQEYHKDQSVFVEGRHGSNFELSITNLTSRRILVHPTVDGLSAMDGKEASRTDNTKGYVLNAYRNAVIPGWRLNDGEVAKFVFAGSGQSYAEKQGKGRNKGVIACAMWEERQFPSLSYTFNNDGWLGASQDSSDDSGKLDWTYTSSTTDAIANVDNVSFGKTNAMPMAAGPRSECSTRIPRGSKARRMSKGSVNNLGTGFGKRADHQVTQTHFWAASTEPEAIATIYYDDERGLQHRGIKIHKPKKNDGLPNPFPKDTGCTPPTGWRG